MKKAKFTVAQQLYLEKSHLNMEKPRRCSPYEGYETYFWPEMLYITEVLYF